MKAFFLLFAVSSYTFIFSQQMSFYADAMVNASDASHRVYAAGEFEKLFQLELEKPNSFEMQFEELEWISIIYPDDRSFRTITWQIDKGNGQYGYYGWLQNASNSWQINNKDGDESLSEYGVTDWNEWSGGLIYNIIDSDDAYTLFTFRYLDQYTKVKTLETLRIKDKVVTLGDERFQDGEDNPDHKDRLVLEYSADANATLNYQEATNRIVYDNLIAVMGRMDGQGPTKVPDGSYKSYDLSGKKWIAKDKLFDQVMESPPRQMKPKSKKDLFGKTKG